MSELLFLLIGFAAGWVCNNIKWHDSISRANECARAAALERRPPTREQIQAAGEKAMRAMRASEPAELAAAGVGIPQIDQEQSR